jgi:hypothetical protein
MKALQSITKKVKGNNDPENEKGKRVSDQSPTVPSEKKPDIRYIYKGDMDQKNLSPEVEDELGKQFIP